MYCPPSVVVEDIFDPALDIISVTPNVGSWSAPNWTIASLNSGATATLIVTCKVNEGGSSIVTLTNTATVRSDIIDPDESNNTSTITIDVLSPSLSITKEGTLAMDVVTPNDRLDAGDKIHYTFTVTNTGNATLTNVAVTEYNSSVTIDNGGVIGTLAIGATVILTGTYTLTQADIDAGTFTNTASVTGKCRNIDYTDEDMDVQILEQIPELLVTKLPLRVVMLPLATFSIILLQ